MAESAAICKLHLIYRLSHIPERFDEAVQGKVRALEGVTSVDDPLCECRGRRRRGQTVPPQCGRRTQRPGVVVAGESAARGRTSRTQGGLAPRGLPPGCTKDAL